MCRMVPLVLVTVLASAPAVVGQSRSTGGFSTGGLNSGGMSSGFSSGTSGSSSFRPNNSTFGSPLGLTTPQSGVSANPFEEARVDPRSQGQVTQSAASNANRNRNNASRNQNNQRNRNQRTNNVQRTTLPVTMIAFPVVERPAGEVAEAVRADLAASPLAMPANDAGFVVTMEGGGVAVVRGTVADARAAQVALAMVRLEPGVRSVRNELTIQGQ